MVPRETAIPSHSPAALDLRSEKARRTQILATVNQKGGVGKTTTTVTLASYLALAGARVLVVDLDPQGNAATGLGVASLQEASLYDVLVDEADPNAAVRQTAIAGLDVLPSTVELAGAEVELVAMDRREYRLETALHRLSPLYDVIFIDCPPSLGLLTINAFRAASALLIPIQCEYYALEGLGQLLRTVERIRESLNQELSIGGMILTMYDARTRLADQVADEVRRHFGSVVFQSVIPRSVRLSEAPGYGQPISLYDPASRGAVAYRALAQELAGRLGLTDSPTEAA